MWKSNEQLVAELHELAQRTLNANGVLNDDVFYELSQLYRDAREHLAKTCERMARLLDSAEC